MKHCSVCKAKYDDSVSFCPVDGEVLEDDPSSIVGTVLDGQYQIDTMLGKGGMGAVYRARHILLGDRVAIKILPPEVRNNAEWLRRFRREGQAARRFRHPNAVTVYDLRTAADGTIYMVMEYVDGHTLDVELRRRGRLTHFEAFGILEPILSVLETAHAMGVVHRDLKPENIMIGKSGTNGEATVKLLDLGIAKMREIAETDGGGATALTVAGQVLGTPYYMSPEQWGEIPHDGSSEIDGRADIYSLGLVFYEMIAGKRPYTGSTLQELRRQHIQVTPKPLHEVATDVPADFSEAIGRATSKDRGDRQATAGELASQLRRSLGSAESQPTVFDFSPGSENSAHTLDINGARGTSSAVDTPTIISVDESAGAASITAVPAPVVEKPLPAVSEFEMPLPQPNPGSAATVVEKADMSSSVTIPQAPKLKEAPVSKSSSSLILVGVVVVVLLLVVGAGGFIAFRMLTSKPAANVAVTTTDSQPGSTVGSGALALKEVGRYWLEVEPRPGAEPIRASGIEALVSGQSLKFHFVFEDEGYVYLIGPGQDNQPTAFLTSKPPEQSGLTDNKISKGVDLSFPSGSRNWLTLDRNPGAEDYTIIFSSSRQSVPDFLNREFTGEPMSTTERDEFNEFLARHKENKAVTELKKNNSTIPFVEVKAPLQSNPIIFEVRIQHK